MTFAAPFFVWAALGVALATVALHLLAWRRPPETPLPTARFAPERPIRMVSRAVKPTDLGLLALRVMLVMLVGLALAGPRLTPRRDGTARVFVVDRSRHAGAGDAVSNAARGRFRPGDALVVFDSVAREVVSPTADSLSVRSTQASGLLSPALVVASRAANRLAREHDSVVVVVVSPFMTEELDAATGSIRAVWPGRLEVVRVGGVPNDTAVLARPEVRSGASDPVAVAVALAGAVRGGGHVRLVRDAMTSADSAWAREGHALVWWPVAVPPDWARRPAADTAFGVSTVAPSPATVVAAFPRIVEPPDGGTVARWTDGEPAATESALGAGCVRSVAVSVPTAGDLALTPTFRRFVERLTTPCDDAGASTAASDSVLARALPATMDSTPARAAAFVPEVPRRSVTAWLLGLALAAAVAELFVRRGDSHAAT